MQHNTETTNPTTYTFAEKDKYGRSCHRVNQGARTIGFIVRYPKSYLELKAERGETALPYFTNDWRMEGNPNTTPGIVLEHATLAEARARFGAVKGR